METGAGNCNLLFGNDPAPDFSWTPRDPRGLPSKVPRNDWPQPTAESPVLLMEEKQAWRADWDVPGLWGPRAGECVLGISLTAPGTARMPQPPREGPFSIWNCVLAHKTNPLCGGGGTSKPHICLEAK